MKTKIYSLLFTLSSLLIPQSVYADVGNPSQNGFSDFGTIQNPTQYSSANGQGLFTFLSKVLKLAGVIAGIYFVVQIIMAGYGYLSAAGDVKKTEAAWAQIWQSIVGIVIVSSAFVIASLVGKFTGINILNPTIYGPK